MEKAWGYFLFYAAGPLLYFALILIGTGLALLPLKRQIKKFKTTALSIALILFGIWFFYPCFTYKGTYSCTRNTVPEKTTEIMIIDEELHWGDRSDSYTLKPFRRMLWLDNQSPLFPEGHYPIKLGWNKVYEWDFKSGGWIRFEKVR